METRCPTCEAPIDPTRAPVAAVRDGRIVTFCSQACAAGTPVEREAEAPEPAVEAPKAPAKRSAEPEPAILGDAAEPEQEREPESEPDADIEPSVAKAPPRRRGKGRVVAVAALFLVGGMLITIIKAVSPSSPSEVVAEKPKADAKATPAPAAAKLEANKAAEKKGLAPAQLYQVAVRALRGMIDSPSPRIQRIAAAALARTKDPKAIATLERLLQSEKNHLSRVQIGYALARAQVPAGRAFLVSSLRSRRRDVRLDAARSLVQLGDDAGNRVLHGMMSYRMYQIGVAGLLARRGDKKALKVLRKIVSGRRYSEDKQRAAVALGRAGEASVKAQLVKMVDDKIHVGAAHALAALGDKAAVAPLERQLDLAAMRVAAAVSLRRLGVDVDLAPLGAALESDHPVSRVTAAEAILVLTGPDKLAGVE